MPRDKGGRTKLLDAALNVIRAKGYEATTVDDICAAAGMTKGGFFHHFASKEALAIAAAAHFGAMAEGLFSQAPYHRAEDPRDRVLGYIDFRAAIMRGGLPEYTCLLGTMVQSAYDTHPAIRDACEREISGHARTLEADLAAAKARHAPDATWTVEGLALYTQAVIQGSFILAKARQGPDIAVECLMHLRRYLETLFNGGSHG